MPEAGAPAWLGASDDGVKLSVRVTARASKNDVSAGDVPALKVFVTAPAVDSKANTAVIKLLAKRLGVARGRLRILRGEKSRDKLIAVDGATAKEVRDALSS
jgi:uncharacterized protein (TIGR00251 family)